MNRVIDRHLLIKNRLLERQLEIKRRQLYIYIARYTARFKKRQLIEWMKACEINSKQLDR